MVQLVLSILLISIFNVQLKIAHVKMFLKELLCLSHGLGFPHSRYLQKKQKKTGLF